MLKARDESNNLGGGGQTGKHAREFSTKLPINLPTILLFFMRFSRALRIAIVKYFFVSSISFSVTLHRAHCIGHKFYMIVKCI